MSREKKFDLRDEEERRCVWELCNLVIERYSEIGERVLLWEWNRRNK